MDALFSPFVDLLKHYIQTNYLVYDDQKVNLLMYSCVSITISFVVKTFLDIAALLNFLKYVCWMIEYKILHRKRAIIPCIKENTPYCPYSYKDTESKNTNIIISEHSSYMFTRVITKSLFGTSETGRQHIYCFSATKPTGDETLDTKTLISAACINTNEQTKVSLLINDEKNKYIVGFVDGYYIYAHIAPYTNKITSLSCNDATCLKKYISIIQEKINSDSDIDMNDNKLLVTEYDPTMSGSSLNYLSTTPNRLAHIGYVKPNLTFDNYVSRHKNFILKKLSAFKSNELYKNNPYMENNLGFLLHGDYGTGKSYFISALANYLNMSICNVNFTKVRTIKQFREIMTGENIKKYIFSFDELDYLLSDLLDNKNACDRDVRLQIQMLSAQISTCIDPEEKKSLIDQMKKLMEVGSADRLTYAFLLSELSGTTSTTGRIIVGTTNFPEKIPDSLKRPGRFDVMLELGKFNHSEIKELLENIYKPNNDDRKMLDNVKFLENKYTPACIIMKTCMESDLNKIILSLT